MSTLRTLSIVLSLSLAAVACGETPQPMTPVVEPPTTPEVTATPDAGATSPAAATAKTYRLVVSFTSKGAGTDAKAKDAFSGVINKWRISKGAELKTERPKWGKEGEMDICSDLTELSEAERTKFLGEVRAAVGKSDRVTITENGTCHEDNKK